MPAGFVIFLREFSNNGQFFKEIKASIEKAE
jgi:hypothetical protein